MGELSTRKGQVVSDNPKKMVEHYGKYNGTWVEPIHPTVHQPCPECGALVNGDYRNIYICNCGRVWAVVIESSEYLPQGQQ